MVTRKLPQNSSGNVKKRLFCDILRKWPLEKYIHVNLIPLIKFKLYDLPHIFVYLSNIHTYMYIQI